MQDGETCIPLPRLADYGLDINTDAVNGAETEERASCLFVKRVLDEKRRASSCFARIAYPYPPPPPISEVSTSSKAGKAQRARERLGDIEQYVEPTKTDEEKWEFDTAGAIKGTTALLDAMGENNPILQSLLKTAKQEITESVGRRLMQRVEYNTRMTDVLITHEIMVYYGRGGIPGVTSGSCEAMCEATKVDSDAARTDQCNAYAFKRASPFSFTDKSGWCYLLQVAAFIANTHNCVALN